MGNIYSQTRNKTRNIQEKSETPNFKHETYLKEHKATQDTSTQ